MGVKCSLSLWRKQKQRARPGNRPHKGAHSPAKLPTLEVPDTGAQRALYSDGALELESHGWGMGAHSSWREEPWTVVWESV